MSTPSTATATLPPHQPHYGYSYHQNYQANLTGHRAHNPLLNGASRVGGTYTVPGTSSNLIANSVGSSNPIRPVQTATQSISRLNTKTPTMPVSQSTAELGSKKRQ